MLVRTTTASALPVSLDDAKAWLRVDHNDEDELITRLVYGAVAATEDRTGRILAPSSWEWQADRWDRWFAIPAFPIRDVTSVVYLDEDGTEQTLDAADWYWHRTAEGAEVRFVSTWSSPTLYDRPRSVRVRFDAGYDDPTASGSGDDPDLVLPENAKMALRFLIAHWYANRESVTTANVYEVPQTFEYLAQQLRIFR